MIEIKLTPNYVAPRVSMSCDGVSTARDYHLTTITYESLCLMFSVHPICQNRHICEIENIGQSAECNLHDSANVLRSKFHFFFKIYIFSTFSSLASPWTFPLREYCTLVARGQMAIAFRMTAHLPTSLP